MRKMTQARQIRGLPLSTSAKFLNFWTPPPLVRTSVRLFVRKIGQFLDPLPPGANVLNGSPLIESTLDASLLTHQLIPSSDPPCLGGLPGAEHLRGNPLAHHREHALLLLRLEAEGPRRPATCLGQGYGTFLLGSGSCEILQIYRVISI